MRKQPKYKFDELAAADCLLLGRVTYEGFAASWPNMMDQYEGPNRAELQEYTDMMNGYPKHVVSTTLEEPLEWNNSTLIEGHARSPPRPRWPIRMRVRCTIERRRSI